jgi:uncharacterized membrane protein YoaK (UPF0700 family)
MSSLLAMLFFQSDGSSAAGNAAAQGVAMVALVLYAAVLLLLVAGMWKVFTKAGEPGWAAIVPIYNFIVLLKIAGKPAWWILLMLIPVVNFVVLIIMDIAIARNFGKGGGFAAGLILLAPVFFPILGFGSAKYQPVAA